jgi:hypothetical protein
MGAEGLYYMTAAPVLHLTDEHLQLDREEYAASTFPIWKSLSPHVSFQIVN